LLSLSLWGNVLFFCISNGSLAVEWIFKNICVVKVHTIKNSTPVCTNTNNNNDTIIITRWWRRERRKKEGLFVNERERERERVVVLISISITTSSSSSFP